MSTLWTPSGEHPIPRTAGRTWPGRRPSSTQAAPPGGRPGGQGGHGPTTPGAVGAGRPGRRRPTTVTTSPAPRRSARPRRRWTPCARSCWRAPVELVISNHAMGLWELAALHLSERPPHLPEAQLAIDALSALVEGLQGRLGEAETHSARRPGRDADGLCADPSANGSPGRGGATRPAAKRRRGPGPSGPAGQPGPR